MSSSRLRVVSLLLLGSMSCGSSSKSGPSAGSMVENSEAPLAGVVRVGDPTPLPKDLVELLDLAPAEAETFIVIRQPGVITDGMFAAFQASRSAAERFVEFLQDTGRIRETEAQLAYDLTARIARAEKALRASSIDLRKGMLVVHPDGVSGPRTIIYAAREADALPQVLRALAIPEHALPGRCTKLEGMTDYAACSSGDPTQYRPAHRGEALGSRLRARLPGVELERGNMFVDVGDGSGPWMVETADGVLHVSIAAPELRDRLNDGFATGTPRALGLIGPGEAFAWGRVQGAALAEARGVFSSQYAEVGDSLTGEFIVGGLADAPGVALLAGVESTEPASKLVQLAMQNAGMPASVTPWGTKFEVSTKTVGRVTVVDVALDLGRHGPVYEGFGYSSHAYVFTAGHHAGVVLGAQDESVRVVERYDEGALDPNLLRGVPAPLARALEAGDAALAMYLPLDPLLSHRSMTQLPRTLQGAAIPGFEDVDPLQLAPLVFDVAAQVSSLSAWVSDLQTGPVVHVALQGFADTETDAGRAALGTLIAIVDGKDRQEAYAALASAHPDAERAPSYRMRAGLEGDPIPTLALGVWVFKGLGELLDAAGASSASKR